MEISHWKLEFDFVKAVSFKTIKQGNAMCINNLLNQAMKGHKHIRFNIAIETRNANGKMEIKQINKIVERDFKLAVVSSLWDCFVPCNDVQFGTIINIK